MPLVQLRAARVWRASAGAQERPPTAREASLASLAPAKETPPSQVQVQVQVQAQAAQGVRCFADSVAFPASAGSGKGAQKNSGRGLNGDSNSPQGDKQRSGEADAQTAVGSLDASGLDRGGATATAATATGDSKPPVSLPFSSSDSSPSLPTSSSSSSSSWSSNHTSNAAGAAGMLLLRDGRSALVAARKEELTNAEASADLGRFYDEDASAAEANSAVAVGQCAIVADTRISSNAGEDLDGGIDMPLEWLTVHNSPVLSPDGTGLPDLTARGTVQSDVLRAKLSAPVLTSVALPLAALTRASGSPLRTSGARRNAFLSKDDASPTLPSFSSARVLALQVGPGELVFHLACGCGSRLCGHHSVPQYMPTGAVAHKQVGLNDPAFSGDGFASLFAHDSDERKTARCLNGGLRQCLRLRCRRPGDLIIGFYWLPSTRASVGNLPSVHRHRLVIVTTAGCEVYAFPPSPRLAASNDNFQAPKKRSWFSFGKGTDEPAQDLGAPATNRDGYWQWTLLAEHRVVDSSDVQKQKSRESSAESKTTVAWHQWSARHRVLLLSPAALATSLWKSPLNRPDANDPGVQLFTYSHVLIPLHFGVPKAPSEDEPFALESFGKESDSETNSLTPALAPLPIVKIPVSVVLPRFALDPTQARTEAAQLQREQYNVAAKSILQRCRLRSHNIAIHQLYAKLFVVHINTHRAYGAELWETARGSMAKAIGVDSLLPRNVHSDFQRASVDLWQLTRDAMEKRLSIPVNLRDLRDSQAAPSVANSLCTSVVDNLLCVHTLLPHDANKDGAPVSPSAPKCLLFDVKDSDPQQPIVPVSAVEVTISTTKNLVSLSATPYFVSVELSASGGGPNDVENVGHLLLLDVDTAELANILSAPDKGLNTPKKAVEVLLKRDARANKDILISVVRQSVLRPRHSPPSAAVTAQTTHLAGMFDMLNFVLAHSHFKLREDWPGGVVSGSNAAMATQTQNGCIVVLQRDMFAEVLSPLVDTLADDSSGDQTKRTRQQQERYIRGVFLEYLRSLSFNNVPPQPFIAELGVQLLARQKQYVQLHQLVQYHVIPDSVPVACTLLALSTPQTGNDSQDRDSDFGPPLPSAVKRLAHVADDAAATFEDDAIDDAHSPSALYAPAAQLAIDMLKRLAAAASAGTALSRSQREIAESSGSFGASTPSTSSPFNSGSTVGLESLHDAQSLRYMVVEALLARHQIVPALRYTLSRSWAAQLQHENAGRFFDSDGAKMSKAQAAAAAQELEAVVIKEQNKFLLLVLRQATRVLEGATLLPAHAVVLPIDKALEEDAEEHAEEVRELRYERYSARVSACAHADFFVVFHAVRKRGLLDVAIREFVAVHEDEMIPINVDSSDKNASALRWFDSQRHTPRPDSTKNPGLLRRLLGRRSTAEDITAPPETTPRRRRGNSVRARDICSEAVSLYAEEYGLLRSG